MLVIVCKDSKHCKGRAALPFCALASGIDPIAQKDVQGCVRGEGRSDVATCPFFALAALEGIRKGAVDSQTEADAEFESTISGL